MSAIESVLDYLCQNRLENKIAKAIYTSDNNLKQEFWLDVHAQLVNSTSCIGFDSYGSIARCHVLCIATSPRCGGIWANIVLGELTRRATDNAHLDAYVMGSQLGLFQAGNWLQEKRQKPIGQNFLLGVARYCITLFGKKCRAVNSSGDAEIMRAHQDLDRAVKNYLRPQQQDLIALIKPEIRAMLVELRQVDFAEDRFNSEKHCWADRWLLDALLHGSIDLDHRNRNALIRAAVAINV